GRHFNPIKDKYVMASYDLEVDPGDAVRFPLDWRFWFRDPKTSDLSMKKIIVREESMKNPPIGTIILDRSLSAQDKVVLNIGSFIKVFTFNLKEIPESATLKYLITIDKDFTKSEPNFEESNITLFEDVVAPEQKIFSEEEKLPPAA